MIIDSTTFLSDTDRDWLEKAIRKTLLIHEQADADLTLQLTDDETIRHLNKTYRDIDKTTDVLAFNQDFINPETNRLYLGDIIISVDRVRTQAEDNNLTLFEECALLAIHGTLHLLGYDHSNDLEKTEMWAIQDKIFQDLMLSIQEETK